MNKKNMGKKQQKALVVFARILATISIIGVILALIPLSLPRFLGYETYNIVSGSMEPELPVGSMVLVKEADPYSIEEGDIIAFNSNATVVTHRVVYNNQFEKKFITKGDANADEDINPVQYNELIGIVDRHYPVMGAVGNYLTTGSGKLLILEILVCSMLLFVVSSQIKI